MGNVRADVATIKERTEQMQYQQEIFARTRSASCPMTPILERAGIRIDNLTQDITENRLDIVNLKECMIDVQTNVKGIKIALISLSGIITTIGTVIGILAACHII